jgi:hypothetical protein
MEGEMLQTKDRYEDALKSEDLKRKLYAIGYQALLGQMAIDGLDTRGKDSGCEELQALQSLLEGIRDELHAIADGDTFDKEQSEEVRS